MADRPIWLRPGWDKTLRIALLLVAAAGCSQAPNIAHRSEVRDQELARAVHPLVRELPSDEVPLAYGWDDRPPTRSLFREAPIRLDYGELGSTLDTLAYLPFNGGSGDVRDASARNLDVSAQGVSWTDGRFGNALRFGSDSTLEVFSPSPPFVRAPFTIQFWLRPDPGPNGEPRDGELLEVPGVLTLALEDAHLVLSVPGGRLPGDERKGFSFASSMELPASEWSHAAVVLESADYPHLRLLLNGETSGLLMDALPDSGHADKLTLGGGFVGSIDELRVTKRAAASAELFEHYIGGAAVGEHELTLEFPSGTRTERHWAGVLTEARVESDWNRGRLQQVATHDDGLGWVPGHWERDRAPSPPRCRTTHPTVYVGNRRTLILGGETHDSHMGPMVNTGDTWIYHSGERRWEPIDGSPPPTPRCHQSAAYSPDHNLVLIAGGMYAGEEGWVQRSDTWVYHVEEKRWEERQPAGAPLPPLSDSGLVYHPGARRFVLFNNRWVRLYDPESDRWEPLPPPAIVDRSGAKIDYSPGGSFMSGYDPESGQIVLFGGERKIDGEHVFQNALAHYDLDSNVIVVQTLAAPPKPRVRAGFAYDSKRGEFLMFGGVLGQESARMDDLWSYHATSGVWRQLTASNPPTPRGGFMGMSYDADADASFLLHGRLTYTLYSNEAWRLRIDERAPGRATFVFDRANFGSADRFVVHCNDAQDFEVGIRLAGSEDGLRFAALQTAGPQVIDAAQRFVKVELTLSPSTSGRVQSLDFIQGTPSAEACTSVPIAPFLAH